jgi:RHS repeat-associated protein
VTAPNGQQTITEYGAGTSASTRYTKVSSQIDALSWKQGYSYYDGLGRTFLTQSVDDVGDEFVMSCFDTAGRPLKSTNPFRGFTTQTCSTTSGLDWTTKGYDTAGRPSTVTAPDGSVATTAYSLATSGTPIGAVTTVTDQAGKLRRSVTNAFGQLARVDEPDTSSSTGSLGAVSSPNQYTTYVYDPLNNLTTVNQGSQTRTFSYDALSRLKSATNPEMGTTATNGTITYQYDANGNLTQKVDPRTITTTYAYDNLNRVKTRTYSDSTLGVSYYYDNLTNAKGKLIKVTNGTGANTSTTEYTAFDILGRVTAAKQTTDGGDAAGYNTAYTYNLAGALINETYPSGRVVQNVLDTNGDLSVVKSSKNAASGFWNYASGFKYTAAGAVSDLKLGNGKWESTVFNNRLQPTQIALGTTQGGTDKLKLNFSYGSTDNNGNVQSQTITVPTVGSNTGFTAVQTYAYDSLNRLGSATEMEGSTQTWKQAFTYDRYGNRNFNESQTTMPASFSNPAVSDPSVSASNNRLTATGYTYDNAGNTTRDGAYQTYTYDAENKQTEVKNSSSVSLGQYWYDGDGKRVKKYVPATGETTVFVYDAAGKQIAEYSTIVASSTDAKVNYLTSDHLGSPRINTDANGAIISRHDYHPFGEEIDGTGGRTIGLNYGDNSVRKQFTGYEFDGETGLDFAGARMYIGVVGRYTTPDPLSSTQRGSAPQTFNRYTYVLNNPLSFVDITGAFPEFAVSVYVRAFAPFAWFGPGNIAKGDNRGFSTDLNASYRIQATSEVTIADDGGYRYYPMHTTYAAPPTTSTTRFDHFIDGLPMEWQAESPTSVSDIGYSHGGADGTTSLSFSEFGNDKAIPGSSNIDLHSNFDFSYQDLGGGSVNMTVTGSVTGDQFPAAEAFIQDKKGNSVMLGVFAPKVGDSPVTKLPGDHKLPMINANVTIVVKSGIFQGILENGKVVSLADYNKRFTGQDAVQPVD